MLNLTVSYLLTLILCCYNAAAFYVRNNDCIVIDCIDVHF